MQCANVCDPLRRTQAKQQYVASPLELSDHSLGNDMVYLMPIQLVCELDKHHLGVLL
jgi:hypothetical protein